VSGREVVLVLFDALVLDSRMHVVVLANEGLIVATHDGDEYRVEVAEHR
jgi:hypothetical protein